MIYHVACAPCFCSVWSMVEVIKVVGGGRKVAILVCDYFACQVGFDFVVCGL